MKRFTFILLLLLGVVAFSQPLFAGTADSGAAPDNSHRFETRQKTLYSMLTGRFDAGFGNASYLFTARQLTGKEYWFLNSVAKYKKKYKRIISSSTRLERPVKDHDPIPVNIFIKESYSKPHFLSHLHRFLFRLTPF